MNGPDQPARVDLTPRELEVLAMVAEGKSNREIGEALFISESTAGVHVSNILGKLGVASRTEAAAFAFRMGMVEPTSSLHEPASAFEEPPADALAQPRPAGWWARLKAQASRHPRSTIVAGGSVVLLTAIMTGLAVAVLSDRQSGVGAASPSPTALAGGSAGGTPSPTPSRTASPSGSPSATPSAAPAASSSQSAGPSATAVPTPTPATASVPRPTPTPAGRWTAAGAMIEGRFWPEATLMDDGSVLVTGGERGYGIGLETVERFHASSNEWTDATFMDIGRVNHTATLLRDGTVLVTGGYSSYVPAGSAAVYDPDRDIWTSVDDMLTPRAVHFATLLEDGRVLVVGGVTQTENEEPVILRTAEVFDPATGNWSETGEMTELRDHFGATLLEDGRVLAVGGAGGQSGWTPLRTIEAYDPDSGTWAKVGELVKARAQPEVVQLADGNVLVAGGIGAASIVLSSAELFDPDTGTSVATGSMNHARPEGTMTLLANGDVLAVGGTIVEAVPMDSVERFDPGDGTWTFDATPLQPRSYHAAVLLADDSVLIVGGVHGGASRVASAERYVLRD